MAYPSQDTLNAIMRSDPDGGDREPTEDDYRDFQAHVINRYGLDTWEAYRKGGWAQDRSEGDWSHFNDGEGY